MSAHAVPFYCPYCGEEDIEPVGERGGWSCAACTRSFTLRLGAPPGERQEQARSVRPIEEARR